MENRLREKDEEIENIRWVNVTLYLNMAQYLNMALYVNMALYQHGEQAEGEGRGD